MFIFWPLKPWFRIRIHNLKNAGSETAVNHCGSKTLVSYTGNSSDNTWCSSVYSDEELFKYFEENSQPETSRSISREKGISGGKIRYCIFQLAHARILVQGCLAYQKMRNWAKMSFPHIPYCKSCHKCFVLERISSFANIFAKVNFEDNFCNGTCIKTVRLNLI